MSSSKQKILILEVHAKAAVPVLESCRQMGLHVIAGSWKKHSCGMSCRAVDQKVFYPRPDIDSDAFFEFLLGFLKTQNIEMLLPVGDFMTDLIAANQQRLKEYVHFILPEYEVFVQGRNKILTLKAAARAGCPIPTTWYPEDVGLEQSIREIASFPVLIKPAISAGARGIVICQDKDEIIKHFSEIQSKYGETFLQDYVPQNGMQFKVDAVMDAEQNLLAGVVYEKLRYYPPEGGSSVLNKTVHRPDILNAAVDVMKELKWVGLCDFDFIEDSRDGVVKLMEINPRFPESFRATVAAGVDMTKILYQLATGQKAEPQLGYQKDRYNRFLFGDLMWFLKTKENRFKAEPSFFKFWDKNTYYQLIRKNDLGPIFGYMMENMEMLWDKKLRKERMR